MKILKKCSVISVLLVGMVYTSCKIPAIIERSATTFIPNAYTNATDSSNSGNIVWRDFFSDKHLASLIDTAIKNNYDVLLTLQDIEIARNNVRFRNGQLLPFVEAGGSVGVEKVGRYTSQGAGDASADITPGNKVPDILRDHYLGFRASWEADIWGKLHNAKKAAYTKFLSSIEGRNFVQTNLIAEIANSYYELLALDNQLDIIRATIQLQQNELEIVRIQKDAAVVTELAVKQFEAQVLNSQGMEFEVLQQIAVNENKINFLLGRFPQKIVRDKSTFNTQLPMEVKAGIPSQLLKNRPDIKQAELELLATKFDVKIARAEFYPGLRISSSIGYSAFKQAYLFSTPESLAFGLMGDLVGPLVNKSAIIAEFNKANAYQIQAMYEYQKAILNGFVEVSTEMSNINNLEKSYNLKSKEVEVLTKSIDIASDLFKSARATYLEVLMTQRDALESKLELVETKKRQFNAVTNIYKSLGGGWN